MAGQAYPWFHREYGNHAEELFFHTSRYYAQTETFLRDLAGDRGLEMAGYSADRLSRNQRKVLACLLSRAPNAENGRRIAEIVRAVQDGSPAVDEALLERYRALHCSRLAQHLNPTIGLKPRLANGVPYTDPFESLARRLGIPLRIRGRWVWTSFTALARHLDSPNPTVRENLQDAIVQLHRGGYRLRRLHLH